MRSSNSKWTMAETRASSWNLTRGDVGRSKPSSAGSKGKLSVIRQILWRQAIQHFAHQNYQLEFNALSHWQPIKLPQDGRDVLTTSSTSNKTCCSILYSLVTPEQIVSDAGQQRVTVVKTRKKWMHEPLSSRLRPIAFVWQIGAAVSIHTPSDTQH